MNKWISGFKPTGNEYSQCTKRQGERPSEQGDVVHDHLTTGASTTPESNDTWHLYRYGP